MRGFYHKPATLKMRLRSGPDDFADPRQHGGVLLPGQAIDGRARFAEDAIDERAFFDHQLQDFEFARANALA